MLVRRWAKRWVTADSSAVIRSAHELTEMVRYGIGWKMQMWWVIHDNNTNKNDYQSNWDTAYAIFYLMICFASRPVCSNLLRCSSPTPSRRYNVNDSAEWAIHAIEITTAVERKYKLKTRSHLIIRNITAFKGKFASSSGRVDRIILVLAYGSASDSRVSQKVRPNVNCKSNRNLAPKSPTSIPNDASSWCWCSHVTQIGWRILRVKKNIVRYGKISIRHAPNARIHISECMTE